MIIVTLTGVVIFGLLWKQFSSKKKGGKTLLLLGILCFYTLSAYVCRLYDAQVLLVILSSCSSALAVLIFWWKEPIAEGDFYGNDLDDQQDVPESLRVIPAGKPDQPWTH